MSIDSTLQTILTHVQPEKATEVAQSLRDLVVQVQATAAKSFTHAVSNVSLTTVLSEFDASIADFTRARITPEEFMALVSHLSLKPLNLKVTDKSRARIKTAIQNVYDQVLKGLRDDVGTGSAGNIFMCSAINNMPDLTNNDREMIKSSIANNMSMMLPRNIRFTRWTKTLVDDCGWVATLGLMNPHFLKAIEKPLEKSKSNGSSIFPGDSIHEHADVIGDDLAAITLIPPNDAVVNVTYSFDTEYGDTFLEVYNEGDDYSQAIKKLLGHASAYYMVEETVVFGANCVRLKILHETLKTL
jgi:hypothetical protein